MQTRLVPYKIAPEIMNAMIELEKQVAAAGLDYKMLELVKIRASQINGCAYCLHMHTRDARKAGESEERLYLVAAWRESPLFSEKERAALAWAESLTLVAQTGAPDQDYLPLKQYFTDAEIVALTLLITTINAWTLKIGQCQRVRNSANSINPIAANSFKTSLAALSQILKRKKAPPGKSRTGQFHFLGATKKMFDAMDTSRGLKSVGRIVHVVSS